VLSSELAKKDNQNTVIDFSRNVFSLMFYFMLILTIIAEIAMPQIIRVLAPIFSKDLQKYTLTIQLARIMFPCLLIISISSILSAILNCYDKFILTSPTPIILNISFIFFCILSSVFNTNVAKTLSVAVLFGGVIEFIWLFYFTCKQKVILYPKTVKIDHLTGQFLNLFSSGFLLVSVTQLNSLIDGIFATLFASAVSYIYYADRLTQLPLTLIGTALSKSALPVLSQQTDMKDTKRFAMQENILFYALFLGIPCAVGLYSIANIAIPLLFQGGKFTVNDSIEVIKCIKILSLVVPCYIVRKIFQMIFFANKDTKTPAIASTASLVLSVILNIIFMRYYSYYGILASTVISSYANLLFLIFYAHKKKYTSFSLGFFIGLLKLVYPVLFMILAISLCAKIDINTVKKVHLFLKLGITIGSAGTTYIIVSWILGMIDLKKIYTRLFAK
jgi:putative peptidoglycan lipid II flippase